MKIIRDKAILLKVRNPKQITTVIPKSKELSMNEVVVNWGLDEAHTLRGLNINVPSHITNCLLYTSPSPRDRTRSRMPSSA